MPNPANDVIYINFQLVIGWHVFPFSTQHMQKGQKANIPMF